MVIKLGDHRQQNTTLCIIIYYDVWVTYGTYNTLFYDIVRYGTIPYYTILNHVILNNTPPKNNEVVLVCLPADPLRFRHQTSFAAVDMHAASNKYDWSLPQQGEKNSPNSYIDILRALFPIKSYVPSAFCPMYPSSLSSSLSPSLIPD